MNIASENIDKLVTIEIRKGNRKDRGIISSFYESARKLVGNKPLSMIAAQRLLDEVKAEDCILLVTGFASYPKMIYGENDGPLGVASLAKAIRTGLNALPVIITGANEREAVCSSVRAAGLNVFEFALARETPSAAATSIVFPATEKLESEKFTTSLFNKFNPKAVISVEAVGPNKKGVKHSISGYAVDTKSALPALEYVFFEASKRKILSIGCIDGGNELGSGLIEDEIRRIAPYAEVCRCPCGSGIACNVKADIVFPANISNWGAYAISAMLAVLLKKPALLQSAETEYRMLEACIMAGAVDGPSGQPIMMVDAVDHKTNESLIRMLHAIVENTINP